MSLSIFVVKCLYEHGELTAKEIAKMLKVPQKAVNVTLGHLKRKGIVEHGTPLTKIYETPYGKYQSRCSAPFKWKLKEEKP